MTKSDDAGKQIEVEVEDDDVPVAGGNESDDSVFYSVHSTEAVVMDENTGTDDVPVEVNILPDGCKLKGECKTGELVTCVYYGKTASAIHHCSW